MEGLFFLGPRLQEIDGEHASIFSSYVLGDSPSWSFDYLLKSKEANVGCFIAILNLCCADAFFQSRKQNISVKRIIGGKRPDKDKSVHLFLETGKSSV